MRLSLAMFAAVVAPIVLVPPPRAFWAQDAPAAPVVDLAGTYRCVGTNAADSYTATLTVTVKGHSYALTWDIDGDDSVARGIGMLDGQLLVVGYVTLTPDERAIEHFGVVAYTVAADSLHLGRWMLHDGETGGTETCRRTTEPVPVRPKPTPRPQGPVARQGRAI